MTPARSLVLLTASLIAAGCSDSPTSPSDTSSTTTTTVTQSFEAVIGPGGSSFYSFTVSQAGTVTLMLASVTSGGRPAPQAVTLRIGIGTPAGEGCAVAQAIDAAPSLQPQFSVPVGAGISCISIADPGQLTATILAAIRFTHS